MQGRPQRPNAGGENISAEPPLQHPIGPVVQGLSKGPISGGEAGQLNIGSDNGPCRPVGLTASCPPPLNNCGEAGERPAEDGRLRRTSDCCENSYR